MMEMAREKVVGRANKNKNICLAASIRCITRHCHTLAPIRDTRLTHSNSVVPTHLYSLLWPFAYQDADLAA